MPIEIKGLNISDVKIIKPKKIGDARGYFSETYNAREFAEAGIDLAFVQDNHTLSIKSGTVRGLHYQGAPFSQDKLIRVVKGRIFDVVVDLRKSSSTFGKWVSAELSAAEWNQILVPVGFAHAICTLEPDTEVIYKVTNYYSAAHDFGVLWSDPDLAINWPVSESAAVLSNKDKELPRLRDAVRLFD